MEVVAVDIGGTKLAMGVVYQDGRILHMLRNATPKKPQDGLKIIADYILSNWKRYNVRAVGVGAPGIVGGDNGGYFLPNVSNLPEWSNFNLRKNLEDLLADSTGERIPLSIESDVFPATAAELLVRKPLFGDLKSHDLFPFFYLTISTGVGGEQAIIDGKTWKIYRNEHGVTEVGHTKLRGIAPNLSPIQCGCKEFDCIETYLGGNHMPERYGFKPEDATPEMRAMVAGNLGKFLHQHELTRGSKVIVVGGRITNEWKRPFLEEARSHMISYFKKDGLAAPNLEASLLGDDVGIVGGWAIAIKHLTGKWPKYQIPLIPNAGYVGTSQPFPKAL